MKKRESAAVVLTMAVLAAVQTDGLAQRASHALHHPVPGDLVLDGTMPNTALAAPVPADQVASAAPASPALPHSSANPASVLRPLESWEPPLHTLDRNTRSPAGARMRYDEVFSPSIVPFKRTQVFDAVDEQGRLSVRDPALRPMDVSADDRPARWGGAPVARFVGEIVVELSPQRPTPIPSVAAEQRVIVYASTGGHAVQFADDSAGNLFARGTERETVRLSYVLEAPQAAFHADRLPSDSVHDIAASLETSPRPALPAWLVSEGERVLSRLGVQRAQRIDAALAQLVQHFRSFRDADLPDDTASDGSLYVQLALGGVGACRHRAYAMALTLMVLGIDARYASNETHAWVEARLGAGELWTRIDLGGWDLPLDLPSASERTAFRPAFPDPYPQPAAYRQQFSAPSAPPGEADAGAPNAPATPGARALVSDPVNPGAIAGGTVSVPSPGTSPSGSGSNAATIGTTVASPGTTTARSPHGATVDDEDDEREPIHTVLTLEAVDPDTAAGYALPGVGFVRGSVVLVRGHAHDPAGTALEGLGLSAELRLHGRTVAVLGRGMTVADGAYAIRATLPFDLVPDEYDLRVATPGDRDRSSALAE